MSKKIIKRLAIVFLILVLVFFAYKIVDLTNYHFVEARAVNYLCDKYEADKDEFELVDYLHSGFHEEPDGEWVDFINWHDFSFEFKYKNKSFFVNRYNGKFYDDYQIYDIEKWCTEWLQENVDEHIDSISIETEDIVRYLNNSDKSNQYVFSKSDAREYISKYVLNPEQPKTIYIYYDEKGENISDVYDNVKSKMDTLFKINTEKYLGTINKTGKFKSSKYNLGPWEYYYSVTKDE